MSKKILILFLLITSFGFSQKENIEVFTKDGKTIEAKRYSSKSKFLKIKTLDGDKIKLDYKNLDRLKYTIAHGKDVDTTVKQYIKISNKEAHLLRRVVSGKYNIYEHHYGSSTYNFSSYEIEYYALKEGEEGKIAQKVFDDDFLSVTFFKNKKGNEVLAEYFSDCPQAKSRISKIKTRENFLNFVRYYNELCGK